MMTGKGIRHHQYKLCTAYTCDFLYLTDFSETISGERPFLILYKSVAKACLVLGCIKINPSLISNF